MFFIDITGRPSDPFGYLGVLIGAWVIFAMPYHLQHVPFFSRMTDAVINPLGKMQPNK
jgi:hypothetical protein